MRAMYNVNSIFSGLKLFSKEQVFRFISGEAAEQTGAEQDKILRMLMSAEKKLPSGVGEGVAIPHLKMPDISLPYTLFASMSQPVEFDAVDGAPVDMVFLLISPERDGPLHLNRLAKVSRLFRDRDFCSRLRGSDNDNDIRALIHRPGTTTGSAA